MFDFWHRSLFATSEIVPCQMHSLVCSVKFIASLICSLPLFFFSFFFIRKIFIFNYLLIFTYVYFFFFSLHVHNLYSLPNHRNDRRQSRASGISEEPIITKFWELYQKKTMEI